MNEHADSMSVHSNFKKGENKTFVELFKIKIFWILTLKKVDLRQFYKVIDLGDLEKIMFN